MHQQIRSIPPSVACYIYGLIATDFERAWAQKMGTVISIAFWISQPSSRFTGVASRKRHQKSKNASCMARCWNKASPEKAGVGGSIPPQATIYNQQLTGNLSGNSPRFIRTPFLSVIEKHNLVMFPYCSRHHQNLLQTLARNESALRAVL
jgi:hypothetical protein